MSYPPRPDRHGPTAYDPRPDRPRNLPAPISGNPRSLPFFATLGVMVIGVAAFFLGFAPYAKMSGGGDTDFLSSENFFFNGFGGAGTVSLAFLLAAAAVAAFGMLPGQQANAPAVAGLSLAGAVTLLFLLIGLDHGLSAGVGLILVLIAAFLQTGLAVAAALASAGVIGGGRPRSPYDYSPPPPYGGAAPGPYGRVPGAPDHRSGSQRPY